MSKVMTLYPPDWSQDSLTQSICATDYNLCCRSGAYAWENNAFLVSQCFLLIYGLRHFFCPLLSFVWHSGMLYGSIQDSVLSEPMLEFTPWRYYSLPNFHYALVLPRKSLRGQRKGVDKLRTILESHTYIRAISPPGESYFLTDGLFLVNLVSTPALLWFNAVGWSWQMLDCLLILLIQCCNVTNSIVPFFPSKIFFVGATSLVLQQQLSQFLHVLHSQPSRRTFWLIMA